MDDRNYDNDINNTKKIITGRLCGKVQYLLTTSHIDENELCDVQLYKQTNQIMLCVFLVLV